MKNNFKTLFISIFALFSIFVTTNLVKASECNICVYDKGGCIIDETPDVAANYGTPCGCTGSLSCSRVGVTQNCACQKAFGSGLLSVADGGSLNTTSSVPAIIGNVIKVILGVSGTVALIFIIWGGIQWMISKGDGGKIGEARKLMTSGMIGIAIIAAAYAITDFVIKQITVIAG